MKKLTSKKLISTKSLSISLILVPIDSKMQDLHN